MAWLALAGFHCRVGCVGATVGFSEYLIVETIVPLTFYSWSSWRSDRSWSRRHRRWVVGATGATGRKLPFERLVCLLVHCRHTMQRKLILLGIVAHTQLFAIVVFGPFIVHVTVQTRGLSSCCIWPRYDRSQSSVVYGRTLEFVPIDPEHNNGLLWSFDTVPNWLRMERSQIFARKKKNSSATVSTCVIGEKAVVSFGLSCVHCLRTLHHTVRYINDHRIERGFDVGIR